MIRWQNSSGLQTRSKSIVEFRQQIRLVAIERFASNCELVRIVIQRLRLSYKRLCAGIIKRILAGFYLRYEILNQSVFDPAVPVDSVLFCRLQLE